MGKFTYENIPQELRSLKQWGLFQLEDLLKYDHGDLEYIAMSW